jgi:hypothetical protein
MTVHTVKSSKQELSNPYQDRVDVAKSLFGVLPADMTLEKAALIALLEMEKGME